ncbi:signal transduction histidine kinase [Streptomyces sp. V3I8]|uniref:sensor histidine kinase n=1 Tax=Streptomyces sp. V3I8 TaxID=3042279 RepID=UPI0027813D91|nr:ATP-binding protein [Streptomyces sp. V3I8]MDQ1034409.1 signal transduction histidine kinase [Streptomyces sp. V3I8]
MELATPPPAARAPVPWYGWWLLPLALGAGTVVAAVVGSDQVRIPAIVSGVVVTAASAVTVRLLIRSQHQLRGSAAEFRNAQAEHSQQWQQHVAALERKHAAERSACDALLAEQAGAHETRTAEQNRAWQERLDRQLAAVIELADRLLPRALERLRAGDSIDDLLPVVDKDAEAGAELQTALRKVLRTTLLGVEREFDRSTSAEQAVISIGSRIHVLTSKLRGRLHEMQGEHGRLPSVARGLMELDQELGPADSLAASIGVLGGTDRPGRQWQEPQRLLSVVRGGIGRIRDFDRVQVQYLPELGVDGGLVDHLTLIFAHLLDNAARYSPPTEPVIVSGKEVPNGVGIEIQDSGKGLSEEKKQEALQSLEGAAPGPGLGGVSEDAHLGLRVVGALARRYGIRVTFADSPWLGTSVVVVVPHKYFNQLPAVQAQAPAVQAPAAPDTAVAGLEEGTGDSTPGGLPRRRRRAGSERTRPSVREDESVATASHTVPSDESFAGLAAFATAGREPSAAREPSAGREPNPGAQSTEHRTEESDQSS